MFIKMNTLKQDSKSSSINLLRLIFLGWFLSGFILNCNASIEKKQQAYQDIIGYWREYIIHEDSKEETALRKIVLNSNGKLEQSIVYELATQCRIWLNNDEISFKDGHLEFWGGEFKGEMSEDKNSIQLIYKQMSNPFLLERIQDNPTIQLLDSLEKCIGGEYAYEIPAKLDDGWDCTDLKDVGINKEKIFEAIDQITNGKHKDIHSLLIVKDGKLVLEEYFAAEGKIIGPFVNQVFRDRVQMLASVTKSVNSALIGIAQQQGSITDLDAPAFELLPEYSDLIKDGKDQIQLKHLLTMSAGFHWNELVVPYSDPRNDAMVMHQGKDLIRYCLKKSMVKKPGEKFVYHSGLSVILGEILKRSVGIPGDKFAEEYLFKPLGISAYKWSMSKDSLLHTGGGLALRPRDMAKFGLLYLNNGKWHGKQIVPEKWVKESTQPHISTTSGSYGYQWWLRSFIVNDRQIDSFYAIGNAGQFIFVFPELDMVVVSTAQNYDRGWSRRFYEMLEKYILPAVVEATQDK
ncbi:serine hydrolase [candidate division KSB1 bacterium]|nr:serine hydrolase [candidate division KSB1 bacterium]